MTNQGRRVRWASIVSSVFVQNLILACPADFHSCSSEEESPQSILKSFHNISSFIKSGLCKIDPSLVTFVERSFDRQCSENHQDLWKRLHERPLAKIR